MSLKKMLLLIILVIAVKSYSQNQKVADRYFEEFSYLQSAKLYKALIEKKGDSSKHTISRLAESYYNNADTEKAEIWYKELVYKYKEGLEEKHLFKYAQVLRSNGKYKESDAIFLKLSSADINNRKEELKKENYLADFSNNKIRIGVRNLAINTEYSDFGGFILNGKSYYTSAVPKGVKKERIYKWNNQPFLNIYKADEEIISLEDNAKDTVLTLVNQRLFENPITSAFHESTPVFTKDGKTIYFTRNNVNGKKARRDKKNTSNLKIYKASFVNGYWINVTELPFNNDEYSVGHPALSSDEKTLYFVSNMPGGYGATDIYKVAIEEGNKYGTPINLGKTINTSEKEMFPFVGADSALYFSSNGHLGLGLLDIFKSKIKKDQTFSVPKNMGAPFNSKRDDFSFYISHEGKKGFFSSNRKEGKGDDDIYSFYLYTDKKICTQTIEGIVSATKTNLPIDGAVVKLFNNQGELQKEAISDSSGKYSFPDILCDNSFVVVASKLDHKSISKKKVNVVKGKIAKADLKLTPLIIGNQIVINPIYFDYNQAIIRADAEYELENIVTVMTNHPEVVIRIEAHTDSRGRRDYNRLLSDRRAKATRDFILSRGIAKNRIKEAVGYGEDRLLNDCTDANKNKCTEEEHQKNRRSYFYIIDGEKSIKIRQEAEKKAQRKINSRNNFLLFLRKNFKKTGKKGKAPEKCFVGEEEKCNNKEIKYRN